MDDDELFDRSMTSLGVEPLDGGSPGQQAKARRRDDLDRREFERAMMELDVADSAAKDRPPAGRPPRSKPRRLKTPPRGVRVDEQLDLHRMRAAAALQRLEGFVAEAVAARLRAVLVITGKGHHSPAGRGVLRQRVEEWIGKQSASRVKRWSDAPARLGGRGAVVLYLR